MKSYLANAGAPLREELKGALLFSGFVVLPCLAGTAMGAAAIHQHLTTFLAPAEASLCVAGGFFTIAAIFWLSRVIGRALRRRGAMPAAAQHSDQPVRNAVRLAQLAAGYAREETVTAHVVAFGAGLACGYDPAILKMATQALRKAASDD